MNNNQSSQGHPQSDRSAGRAAGYCWARNPNGPGRCTWPPEHSGAYPHKDVYARTEWK